jgi:hypothetical protein
VVLQAFFALVYTGVCGVIAAVKSALEAAKRVPVVIKRGLMKPESVPVKANEPPHGKPCGILSVVLV